ncbi:MAG: PAS domain S-box protein, partial [FCB group bacterium]|nr:PAS domain S-box protein [FCB group bacterium]
FFEWRHCQYDKTEFDAEVSLNKLTLSGKTHLLAIVRDVTARKQAEEALRSSEEKFRTMVENSNDLIWMTDTEGKLTYANKRAEEIVGYKVSEVLNREFKDFVPAEDVSRLKKIIHESLKGESQRYHAHIFHRNGSLLTLSVNKAPIHKDGKIVGTVSFARDITEELQLKKELAKAEKLESIGVLAGGIAHDFNNFLTGILGSLSLAKMGLNSDSETFECLDEAEKATVRARDLTQQLLTFSKGGEPIKKTASITNLIKDTVSFVLRGSNIKPEFFFDDNLNQVEIDTGQISQVIHNLILNAKQAMPEGGTIKIKVQNKEFKKDANLPLKKGKYIKIIITDEGIGIPEKILPKIFDPYFTTKQSGSGLGLASCYSIIKKHDGHIAVTTKLGEGTTFRVYLPASINKAKIKKENLLEDLHGIGRILIMDDEEIIRHLSGKILIKFGYSVDYAEEGSKAIELYKQAMENNQPYDAVILDMTIPGGLGGLETLEHLYRLDSKVKAIVCSGYSNDPVMADFRKYGFCGVLPKPFRPKDLGSIIKQVLQDNIVPVNS